MNNFQIRPTILIDENGNLVILACSRYKGEHLQFVHPPLNPSLMNISPNKPERLDVTQQQLHVVKTGEPKFNSHSNHSNEGSFSGISSSTLQFPTFFEKSIELQDLAESLTARHRHDVYKLIEHYCENNIVDERFSDFLYNSSLNLTATEILHALHHATTVSLYDAFRVQLALNQTKEENFDYLPFPIYAHTAADLKPHGSQPSRFFTSSNPCETISEALASLTTKFLELLRNSTNANAENIRKTLTNVLQLKNQHNLKQAKTALHDAIAPLEIITPETYALEFCQLFRTLQFPVFELTPVVLMNYQRPIAPLPMIFYSFFLENVPNVTVTFQ